jgi:hypothetical protein
MLTWATLIRSLRQGVARTLVTTPVATTSALHSAGDVAGAFLAGDDRAEPSAPSVFDADFDHVGHARFV